MNETINSAEAQPLDWQQTIWREWRNTPDAEYAAQLYELVADQLATILARLGILLMNGIAGATIAFMLGFIIIGDNTPILPTMLAGGVIGLFYGLITSYNLTWRGWLKRISRTLPAGRPGMWMVGAVLLFTVGSCLFSPIFVLLVITLFWCVGGLIDWLNSGLESKTDEHSYRHWYSWWRESPPTPTILPALKTALAAQPEQADLWQPVLHRLERTVPDLSPEGWVIALQNNNWVERFIARHQLFQLGQRAVPALQMIALDEQHPRQPIAAWVLRSIN